MPVLTLIVPTRDPGPALDGLITSIDDQVASRDAYEVVLVDGGSSDGTAVRLERLAGARPNVRLLTAAPDADLAALVKAGLDDAAGDLVLVLRPEQRLTAGALELLAAAAGSAAGGADVVVGRAVSSPVGDGLPLTDGPVDLDDVRQALPRGLVAVRRTALLAQDDPAAALLDPTLVPAGVVVAVGTHACLAGPEVASADGVPARVTWSETELVVEIEVDGADTSAWLALTRADGAAEVLVRSSVGMGDRGGPTARAAIDLAPGGPLSDGVWSVRVRRRSGALDATSALALDATPAPAVLAGRQVVPATEAGLSIDVGATDANLVGRVSLGDARLSESARGALLTLGCRRVHVAGDSRSPVAVLLGRFRLPAELVCVDGSAHVESWVSGLAGRSRISVQTGGGRPRRTGLELRIAGTGVMSLARTPRSPAAQPPAAPAGQASVLRRLRRRVPAPLEPVVRQLSRARPLRALYRRATAR